MVVQRLLLVADGRQGPDVGGLVRGVRLVVGRGVGRLQSGEVVDVARRRGRRRVRRVVAVVEEEGGLGLDRAGGVLQRHVGVDVGGVVARVRAVVHPGAIAVEGVVELADVALDRTVPVRPTRRDVLPVGGVRVPVEVLPVERGAVAGRGEIGGDRVLLVAQAIGRFEATLGLGVVEHPVVVGVLAAQGGGARWAALGVADEVVVEGGALIADQLLGVGQVRQLRHGQVIGEDEHDVRPGSTHPRRRRRGRRRRRPPTGAGRRQQGQRRPGAPGRPIGVADEWREAQDARI